MPICSTPTCDHAGLNQPDDAFGRRSATKLRGKCKACTNRTNRTSYVVRDNSIHLENVAALRHRNRAETKTRLHELLRNAACIDCGLADPVVLDWDHRVLTEKRSTIATLVQEGHAWPTIQVELAKCDSRCSNCHMRKVYQFREDGTPGWRRTLADGAARSGMGNLGFALSLLSTDARQAIVAAVGVLEAGEVKGPRTVLFDDETMRALRQPNSGAEQLPAREVRQLVVALFYGVHSCADCGNDELEILTADHVHAKRVKYIADLMAYGSLQGLMTELAKCEARCWNCHMRVTYTRAGVPACRARTLLARVEEPDLFVDVRPAERTIVRWTSR